jgi:hypothetical protein
MRVGTARGGRIARPTQAIRAEFNTRPRNGQEGKKLVLWLDGPRLKRETDLFEGPGAEALNEQGRGFKAEFARKEELQLAVITLQEKAANCTKLHQIAPQTKNNKKHRAALPGFLSQLILVRQTG